MNYVLGSYINPGHPAAFSGITNLKRELGSGLINRALEQINSYTIKREAKKPKNYNPYFVWDKRKHIQIDLIDYAAPKLKPISSINKFKYLFCAIDGFTRYAWVIPMADKKDTTCVATFNRLLEQMGEKPKRVISDRGSEFTSAKFTANLKRHNIRPIYANFKAGIVERFQRSLQSMISKYQSHYNTRKFSDVLPKLLSSYNKRFHRIIGMSPSKAELPQNTLIVRKKLKAYYDKTSEKQNILTDNFKIPISCLSHEILYICINKVMLPRHIINYENEKSYIPIRVPQAYSKIKVSKDTNFEIDKYGPVIYEYSGHDDFVHDIQYYPLIGKEISTINFFLDLSNVHTIYETIDINSGIAIKCPVAIQYTIIKVLADYNMDRLIHKSIIVDNQSNILTYPENIANNFRCNLQTPLDTSHSTGQPYAQLNSITIPASVNFTTILQDALISVIAIFEPEGGT